MDQVIAETDVEHDCYVLDRLKQDLVGVEQCCEQALLRELPEREDLQNVIGWKIAVE